MQNNKVWVVGHKNPDTDSICSAIAYANLKNLTDKEGKTYIPKRAGEVNSETAYVLERFGVEAPEFINEVSVQIKDIQIRKTEGVDGDLSLKKAWDMMKEENVTTLAVTDENTNKLEGLITTADIATSLLDVRDNNILAKTRTPYKNILKCLNGTMICGDEDGIFTSGKVIVGSANPETMEEFLDEGDLVIMGNRYEAQFCALECNAACLVIAGSPKITKSIERLANEKGCVIITTDYDTYTTARLINHSMPIKCFMRSKDLLTFDLDDTLDYVQQVSAEKKYRYFPIVDEDDRYVGMFSRRNMLNMKKKQLILLDHNEKSQAVDGYDEADILEIIDHHRIGSLETLGPITFRNQPIGSTCSIVYLMYKEQGIEIEPNIAGLLLSAVISDTLLFKSPTCTPLDKLIGEDLAKIAGVDIEKHAIAMFKAGSNFQGKTADEILYGDFKVFGDEQRKFGVSQITAMTRTELMDAKDIISPYLETAKNEKGVNLIYVLLTNILDEVSYLVAYGDESVGFVNEAYNNPDTYDGTFVLPGVVSRKKQLIPSLLEVMI